MFIPGANNITEREDYPGQPDDSPFSLESLQSELNLHQIFSRAKICPDGIPDIE
jgi:hypothetical protein